MSHTKPYIRKKAVLIMYKVFLKYPESLRPAFPRLKEKLEDPDPGIRKVMQEACGPQLKITEEEKIVCLFSGNLSCGSWFGQNVLFLIRGC